MNVDASGEEFRVTCQREGSKVTTVRTAIDPDPIRINLRQPLQVLGTCFYVLVFRRTLYACIRWTMKVVPVTSAQPEVHGQYDVARSEERRVGKECRSRWSTYH